MRSASSRSQGSQQGRKSAIPKRVRSRTESDSGTSDTSEGPVRRSGRQRKSASRYQCDEKHAESMRKRQRPSNDYEGLTDEFLSESPEHDTDDPDYNPRTKRRPR